MKAWFSEENSRRQLYNCGQSVAVAAVAVKALASQASLQPTARLRRRSVNPSIQTKKI